MKYLIPLIFILTSCASVKDFSHEINIEKQRELVNRVSPVTGINLFHISLLAFLVAAFLLCTWYVAWKKNQNKDVAVSGESS